MTDEHLILYAGALLAGGLVASFLAGRLRLPSLVLFLGIGMLVGSDTLGWITFDNYRLTRTIGTELEPPDETPGLPSSRPGTGAN
jgi:potassium/hydrogen antiporter